MTPAAQFLAHRGHSASSQLPGKLVHALLDDYHSELDRAILEATKRFNLCAPVNPLASPPLRRRVSRRRRATIFTNTAARTRRAQLARQATQ